MKIEKVKINELISPNFNPRTISDDEMDKLKNSLTEFGYIDPIIVNKHNNHIVGGNQRFKALKELGYTSVDVVFIDEPDIHREKALNIALNKISGEWDSTKLEQIFEEFRLNDFNIELTGFDDIEIEELEINLEDEVEQEETTSDKYTGKIETPIYEITGEKPEINELVQSDRVKILQTRIKQCKFDKEIEEFLINASYRFLEFNYSKIAEFYAHSDAKLQEVMEDLVLVIIDYNRAIELGFVGLNDLMKEEAEKLCQNQ